MRWIKHMTASSHDERIAAYLEACGPSSRHEGYGFYWMMLEAVASQIDSGSEKCSATYPLTTWSRLLYCHHHTVGKYLGKLEVTGLVTVKKHGCSIEVIIPNLLKYRDEYSRKSGQSQESVPTKKQIQNIETEAETDNNKTAPEGALFDVQPIRKTKGKRTTEEIRKALGPRLSWWEKFWAAYPCHEGMNPAMDAFERLVTSEEIFRAVMGGAGRYAAKARADPNMKLKYGQGWLNDQRWTDEDSKAAVRQVAPTVVLPDRKWDLLGDMRRDAEARKAEEPDEETKAWYAKLDAEFMGKREVKSQ